MRTKKQTQYLGIKLSPDEEKAIIQLADSEGMPKSIYARRILRAQLISLGAITIHNPMPQEGVPA